MTTKPKFHALQSVDALPNAKSGAGSQGNIALALLDNKAYLPLEITIGGAGIIAVSASENQLLKSDVAGTSTTQVAKMGISPLNGVYRTVVASTLNIGTGAVTGGFSGITAPPAMTAGQKIHMGVEVTSAGSLTILWGTPASNPSSDTILWSDDGLKRGFVLLTCDSAGTGWAANRFTAPVDTDVVLFPVGGGAGGSGDSSFKLKGIVGGTLTLVKGFMKLSDGRELATGNITSGQPVDVSLNLTTVLGASPADNTTYYLYADLWKLSAVTLSDTGRKVYPVHAATHFLLSTKTPQQINPARHVYLGTARSTTGGTWSTTAFGTAGSKVHDLSLGNIAPVERYSAVISTTTGLTTLSHNLSGRPHLVTLRYFDGTTTADLNLSSYVTDCTGASIGLSLADLPLGSGKTLTVEAMYFPVTTSQIVSPSTQFESGWLASTSVTELVHGLIDELDIKAISVIEWDVTEGKYRCIAPLSLVTGFDRTKIYLDWSGFSPSATMQYRVVTGGSALPSSLPYMAMGFNKFVGYGPGSYSSIEEMATELQPGDSVLVNRSHPITTQVVIAADDVKIEFRPNASVSLAAANSGIRITGSRVDLVRPTVKADSAVNIAAAISVAGSDVNVERARVLVSGATLTDAYRVEGTASRAYLTGSIQVASGSVTTPVNDQGADSDYSIRG